MLGDFLTAIQWWGVVVIFGWIGWPMVRRLFETWEDQGYLFAKAVGLLIVSFGVWLGGILNIVQFGPGPIWLVAGVVGAIEGVGWIRRRGAKINWRLIVVEEMIMVMAFVGWVYVKAHEPTINGLEKFMDYGFTRSIQRSESFPPADMWYAGEPINYYYFGHLMMAVVSTAANVDLDKGFNLMLATLFAMCLTMSFGIGRQMLAGVGRTRKLCGAVLIAILVTMAGNLQTIYAFTKGYSGSEDNPPPFWEIFSDLGDKKEREAGWNGYWYPNATRFIPYTIHEFPSYSFVVSDIHGHVLSIPLVLLLIAMLCNMFGRARDEISLKEVVAYGFVAGAAFMTNALDGPIYFGLFALLLVASRFQTQKSILKLIKPLGTVVIVFGLTVAPFVMHFKPFVTGIAVNCPPEMMAESKIGPFVFEGVEKCQKSPLWMLLILWGFFVYCGLGLWATREESPETKMLKVWTVFCLGLIVFAEFFYFKDIYPQHFRSNTMFKLGYQVFILMGIMSGYVIATLRPKKIRWQRVFGVGLVPLVFLVLIYPVFSVKSYFGKMDVAGYKGIYGLGWMQDRYPDDFAAIEWLNSNIAGQPVILEANGDSYTDYERISTFTGLPTVAGWTVHEWLWRGGYEPISARAEEVRKIYEGEDVEEAKRILTKYKVEYVVIGNLERQKYKQLDDNRVLGLGEVVFTQGETQVLRVR